MKLFDATLDLAAFAKGTEDYTVSEVHDREIVCDDLSGRVAEFGGGTIWIRTGESAGYFGKIQSNAAQTIVLAEEVPVSAGDEITIGAWLEFDTQKLINAVNSVLRMYKIMKVNDELVFDKDMEFYPLPDGVTEDIRAVRIYDRKRYYYSHYWRLENGMLDLYDRHAQYYNDVDARIELQFADFHGAVGRNDEISSQIDPVYLRYMSWLYLCRNLIQQTHKDNLVASDMYNEAKIYERDYGRLPNKRLKLRTMTFPQW